MTLPLHDLWCAVSDRDSDHADSDWHAERRSHAIGELTQAKTATFQDDATLAERIRQGDRGAFERVLTAYAEELVQLATIMLRDPDAAEDVVQDVFVRVWDGRERWVLRGALRGYLMRAVANHVRNTRSIRANRRRLERQERETLMPSPLGNDSGTQDPDALLWAAVDALPDRWREAVCLRYVQRLTFAEVGDVLHISEDAAKKIVRRALGALRKVIVAKEDE